MKKNSIREPDFEILLDKKSFSQLNLLNSSFRKLNE